MENNEKVIYTHNCQNSTVEIVKPKEKNFNLDMILSATSGELYDSAIKKLKTNSADVLNFLTEDIEEIEDKNLGRSKSKKAK
jgi:hypothetical protein